MPDSLLQYCQNVEEALANKQLKKLIQLDEVISEHIKTLQDKGLQPDADIAKRLIALYPKMIELCRKHKKHLNDQQKEMLLQTDITQRYRTAANLSTGDS